MSELTFPAEINNLAVWSTVSTQSNAVSTRFLSAAQVVVASSPFRVGAFLLDFPKRWDEKKQKEHGREGPSTHLPTETSWVVPAENLQLRP